jgi:hypothetical protein
MSTPTFHADMKCGACEGPLEDDRNAICHTCTAPTAAEQAASAARMEGPCPNGACAHPFGDHGMDNPNGTRLRIVCCHDCPCGWGAP